MVREDRELIAWAVSIGVPDDLTPYCTTSCVFFGDERLSWRDYAAACTCTEIPGEALGQVVLLAVKIRVNLAASGVEKRGARGPLSGLRTLLMVQNEP
jgi:hypothetical protein